MALNNKEDFSKCSIYDLRTILRSLGGTPGVKTKGELVEEILKIKNKEVVPERSTRGRKAAQRVTNGGEDFNHQIDVDEGERIPQEDVCSSANAEEDSYLNATEEDERLRDATVIRVRDSYSEETGSDTVSGVFELCPDGYGFLRYKNYENSPNKDTFIARPTVKSFGLRRGDFVVGRAERTRETGASSLTEIISVNGLSPKHERRNFDDLTPCYPKNKFKIECPAISEAYTLRIMDLLSPIGKGQRGLIVAPPKTGKTTLLKRVAQAIEENHPEVHLIMLLIDERPEEVTDLRRSIKGEVVYSTFDESADHHIRAAELVLWRAKRLVELGKDVVILLDSITRLTRAYNQTVAPSGKVLTGGIDPMALQPPKKFFGAARYLEEGGSLTILATALVDTGSKMDDIIYEEFKGTGNMEMHLSRALAERRIFPAIDLYRSGTRKDEFLLNEKELDCAYGVRKFLKREDGAETLIDMIKRTETNDEFVNKFATWVKLIDK